MGRRNDHSREEICELALQAARRIVDEQGFHGLSARKIATAIGYTVGSLYLVFNNLDDLILQVNAITLDELYAQMENAAYPQINPADTVLAISQAYLDYAVQYPHRWLMIFEHRMAANSTVPAWYQPRINRLFDLAGRPMKQLLHPQPPEYCAQATHILWGSVHGICALVLTGKLAMISGESPGQMVTLLVQRYLTGLTVTSKI